MTKHRTRKPKPASKRARAGARAVDAPEPDFHNAERLLLQMMAIPGPSGREGRIMDFVRRQLRRGGAPEEAIHSDRAHRRSPFGGEIGNLALRLPGAKRGGRRLLMAHVDTVPLCVGCRPVIRGRWIMPADKTTALGADDRSGAAVVLATALALLRQDLPHPPVSFLWTVQEEVGLIGARYARLGIVGKPRLAFNFDGGSSEKLTVGATGGYRIRIRVHGIASHAGGAPEEGVSAITIAAMAIAQLEEEGWHGLVEKGNRRGTCNVGVIRGGDATNVVTPEVELRAEARSHDPAFRQRIVKAVCQAFRGAARNVRNVRGACGKVDIEGHLDYEAFELPSDEPSVIAAERAVGSVGGQPVRAICNGGLDANWMTARAIPTVTLGSGQRNPHTVQERLDIREFRRACQIALRLATATEGPGA